MTEMANKRSAGMAAVKREARALLKRIKREREELKERTLKLDEEEAWARSMLQGPEGGPPPSRPTDYPDCQPGMRPERPWAYAIEDCFTAKNAMELRASEIAWWCTRHVATKTGQRVNWTSRVYPALNHMAKRGNIIRRATDDQGNAVRGRYRLVLKGEA